MIGIGSLKRFSLLYSVDMWKRIFKIAKKEFKDNLRNRWVMALALIFLGLSVLVSFYGTSTQEGSGWFGLQNTVLYLTTYIEYMVPILALILGYGAVVREKEEGTMQMLLSYPVSRGEVLAGKFLGLWMVIIATVTSGLGIGGAVIGLMVEDVVWAHYYLFILASILLGGAFLSISMMLSVVLKNSRSAMSGSVFVLFLFTFLWLFSMYALAEVTFGWETLSQGTPPRWYFSLQLLNPTMIWYTLLAIEITPLRSWALEFGGAEPQTHPYDMWVMIILLIVWICVPLILSEYAFKKQDIG